MSYIDRDLIVHTAEAQGFEMVSVELLKQMPAADVQPVIYGEWYDVGSLSCRCNRCGCKNNKETDYCPNCGARMVMK